MKSIVLPLAAPLAALYVSNKFGHIQAETASLAMRTARSKVRLDLFHKRITVFEATDGILQKGSTRGQLAAQDRIDYLQGTQSAIWLFEDPVVEFLNKNIYESVGELVSW